MRTHHLAMDVNRDGVVSWDDFDQMVRRFKENGVLNEKELSSLEGALKVSVSNRVWQKEGADCNIKLSAKLFP